MNGFVVVRSPDLGLTISGGAILQNENICQEIGHAILKAFAQIEKSLQTDSQGDTASLSKLVSIGEACALLQVSASTIRRMIAKGKLSAVQTEGGHRRISLSNIEKLRAKL